MKANIELITQRKELYGNNFTDIARRWTSFLGFPIDEAHVCRLMADMKQSRIDALQLEMSRLRPEFDEMYERMEWTLDFKAKCDTLCRLKNSLQDSELDKACYLWIANHWDEYLEL